MEVFIERYHAWRTGEQYVPRAEPATINGSESEADRRRLAS
jgi:hypothetical protein